MDAYREKALSYSPIAYWMQGEPSGATAECEVLAAQDGAYTGVTLEETGIGDGRTCPFYDGATSYTDMQTATFAGRFNGAEGTAMVWAKVANIGVWTDAAWRMAFKITVNANNYIQISRSNANTRLGFYYRAGGVTNGLNINGLDTVDWMCLVLTWDKAADEMKVFYNGAQSGATQNGLGVWAGAPTISLIGADDLVPTYPWHGWLAHAVVLDSALAPADIVDLAIVPAATRHLTLRPRSTSLTLRAN